MAEGLIHAASSKHWTQRIGSTGCNDFWLYRIGRFNAAIARKMTKVELWKNIYDCMDILKYFLYFQSLLLKSMRSCTWIITSARAEMYVRDQIKGFSCKLVSHIIYYHKCPSNAVSKLNEEQYCNICRTVDVHQLLFSLDIFVLNFARKTRLAMKWEHGKLAFCMNLDAY